MSESNHNDAEILRLRRLVKKLMEKQDRMAREILGLKKQLVAGRASSPGSIPPRWGI